MRSGSIFDIESLKVRAATLNEQSAKEDFWNDPQAAQKVLRERAEIDATVESWQKLANQTSDAREFLGLAEAEKDLDAAQTVIGQLDPVEAALSRMEIDRLLAGPEDRSNAIVSISPGAGGTESQDWAEMLYRMYTRYCEARGFKVDLADYQPGDEAGIKGVTFFVQGEFAYGYLRTEAGVHRLVRISPFDAAGRRHTSFAAVFVTPELDDSVVIDIRDEDLRIDTYRAGGKGGQHVNKTESAVRLTHMPTGIVVACQNERSQHKNKASAMKVLRSRLYQKALEEQQAKNDARAGTKMEIGFGSQIRSYVLAPYRLIKDHRTDVEMGNVDAVLDGQLDRFIQAALMKHAADQRNRAPS
jgi:peptide chain release factor 2